VIGAGVAGRLDRDLRASQPRFITEIGGEGILIAAAATVAFSAAVSPGSPTAYTAIGLLAFAMGAQRYHPPARDSDQPDHDRAGVGPDRPGLTLGGGSAVLARRQLTSPFSQLAGALLGATLYLHHGTALPLALAGAAEILSAAVSPRTRRSHIPGAVNPPPSDCGLQLPDCPSAGVSSQPPRQLPEGPGSWTDA
jgi:hypothetical protein